MAEAGDVETVNSTVESQRDDRFPLNVVYCGVCTYPRDFCDFTPKFSKCKEWWKENHPDLYIWEDTKQEEAENSEKSSLSQKSQQKATNKQPTSKKVLTITIQKRNKKKFISIIAGLERFDIKLTEASKFLSKRFACSTSVKVNKDVQVIMIQGDVSEDIEDVVLEKWGDKINSEDISVVEDKK